MTLAAGTRLGPYEILSPLGAGGMGEVYRANDSKLDRAVAIKVLPQSVSSDPGRLARFAREAKAVAALSHPNILAIHDYGIQDGVAYAVMELLSGQTLRDRLDSGPLPQQLAIEYAIQIAKGLSAAHEKGIVHRDLKPENLFVSKDGHVKILDFGLAKKIETIDSEGETNAPTQSAGTEPGTVMGTIGYMSPEQVRGRKVDHRSDMFSFGAILYEMLSGARAFKRDTASDTMAAIIRDDPPGLNESERNIPVAFDHVVRHCLEKDPNNRFQGTRDIVFALTEASGSMNTGASTKGARSALPAPTRRRPIAFAATVVLLAAVIALLYLKRASWRTGIRAGRSDQSIAVLPFVNMSDEKSNESFSDGISEELLNLLAKVPQLQVTARTSSFSFKGKNVAIPEIARTLHVAHVLEGSVRKAGDRVRITAQLIRAGTDTQLWSQTYDRKLDDIFAIQDEIADDVVKQLKVTLLGASPKTRQTDPAAYALYLQAVQLGRQQTAEAFQRSDALYRKVLAIDPRYVPAWTALAENFYHEADQGLLSNNEGYAQSRETATRALAIDPEYAPAHAGLGWIAMSGGANDLAAAAQHFQRALELDPSDLYVLRTSAVLLQSLGRMDESLALDEAIVRRDPVNVTALFNLGLHQRYAGRLDAAIASYRTVLSLAPGRGGAHAQLADALLLKGDAQGALAEIQQETSEVWKMIGLPMAHYALGRKADSDDALAELIAKYEKDWSYNIAYVYADRGDADKAFAWLDKAIGYGDPGIGEVVTENLFERIHSDQRWLPFLRKLGKTPEQLAKIHFKVTLPK